MSSHGQTADVTGKRFAALALAALGVVYGDIGTSPLYAVKEVFAGNHPIPVTMANIYGSLSLFFWALVIVVSVKYVTFIMRADNRGEGGIMALIALALHTVQDKPHHAKWIMIVGVLGAAMFYGDGMVTPAISVLSAVEGLEVATPALKPFVIPITMIVLFLLFFVQRSGTATVGAFFGPVMLVWFTVLALLGLHNIIDHPAILAALNPLYGFEFLLENKAMSLVAMGNVVLAVTGAEALYADMGHFGRKPISRAWFAFVLPALVLNYFGQGALILGDPEAAKNPFFLSAPEWALYPLVGLATVATVIASQAVISGAFSVTRQAMQLGFVPRMEVQHTSEKEQGQIYLPAVNWGLMVAVMILVLGFKSSNNLAAAYGIAVTGDMVITSILATVVVAKVWKWGWFKAGLLFACFLSVELVFLAANILKIPDGGWFPLVAGMGVFVLMTTWKRGRQLLSERLRGERLELSMFLDSLASSMPTRVAGTSVFLNADPKGVPHALLHNLMHNKVLHERVVLLSVQFFDVPYVPDIDRVEVRQLKENFWSVIIQYGFKDLPNVPDALALCADAGLVFNALETSYFIGRETLIPRLGSDMAFWREKIFVAMFRNAGSATAFFKIPSNRVVELGTQVVL
ncbi:potassium transporter Kup [Ferribacterium limneticum]|uniref:potassium transporter Kup n=1 Tax=Ferribacterium limneticum TaxID=76259 RepID=UPI001CFBF7BD|nr:potassium transporter Kup [Ferribacterium limneticum]UCV29017.1 potassium transporter Kup [Ferribacterium limneticum]UCV32935.1 potassium transporter Kup [Ferribacterium limneticum]